MEYKNCKTLRNTDLKLYKVELENEYERVKKEIKDRLETLDKLDIEYNKLENEIKKRGNQLY